MCPKIEDEKSDNKSNVEERHAYLKKFFKNIAVLHGKMKSNEKIEVLENFRKAK